MKDPVTGLTWYRTKEGLDDDDPRKHRDEQPKERANVPMSPARQSKPFIEQVPEPEHCITVIHHTPVVMSHPATAQLPEARKTKSEVERRPEVPTAEKPKSEDYSSDRKIIPPKSEEKASKPEVGSSGTGTKNKKGRKFNGAGGRIHTEAHIDRILDEYILTGKLPSYVSERQRYDYRHHIRLPERRQLLGKQQAAGDKASGTSTTTGTKDNITHFPGTGTHDS